MILKLKFLNVSTFWNIYLVLIPPGEIGSCNQKKNCELENITIVPEASLQCLVILALHVSLSRKAFFLLQLFGGNDGDYFVPLQVSLCLYTEKGLHNNNNLHPEQLSTQTDNAIW